MALGLPLAAYEFRAVIRLNRYYLPKIEELWENYHHQASNKNWVFTKTVVESEIKLVVIFHTWLQNPCTLKSVSKE